MARQIGLIQSYSVTNSLLVWPVKLYINQVFIKDLEEHSGLRGDAGHI